MLKRLIYKTLFFILLLLQAACDKEKETVFESNWEQRHNSSFMGSDYWANRLQDWQINNGRLECVDGKLQMRTLQLLTRYLGNSSADFSLQVKAGIINESVIDDEGAFCGFLIGCGRGIDYRAGALVHYGSGVNGGLVAAITQKGELVFLDNEDSLKVLARSGKTNTGINSYNLKVVSRNAANGYTINLLLLNEKNEIIQECILSNFPSDRLGGGVAIVANKGADTDGRSFWFNNLKLMGDKFEKDNARSFGPIAGVQYTLSENVLKLTAQLFPLSQKEVENVSLEIKETVSQKIVFKKVEAMRDTSFVALFKQADWNSTLDYTYRVSCTISGTDNKSKTYVYEGKINKEPIEKNELVIATLNCNSVCYSTFNVFYNFDTSNLWFPHTDLVKNIKSVQPDLLLNMGDQIYEERPTGADKSGNFSSYLDYLYKWYLWYWAFGDLTREIPSVCLTDDHDVFHGNLWGAGGIKAREYLKDNNDYPEHYKNTCIDCWKPDGGGYIMPAAFVNMVECTQTAHLPDAYDTATTPYGLKSYYTSMKYGGVDFALLEDRKFKSSPSIVLPDAEVVNGFSQLKKYDAKKFDVEKADLLGQKQEEFLEIWARNGKGASIKIVVSQSVFANVATMPPTYKTDDSIQFLGIYPKDFIPKGYDFAKDMDSHGWPQSGRNRAVELLRKGGAFHVSGDQHLGVMLQYGKENYRDGVFSFCVPPIANTWPRRWFPPYEGKNREKNSPYYTGDYEDGFGNKISLVAAANPYVSSLSPAKLYDLTAGYGILKVNTRKKQITVECWPSYASAASEKYNKQFTGWPVVINALNVGGEIVWEKK